MTAPQAAASGRPWDTGPGLFGRFDPIVGRFLTPPGWTPLDMGTADWIRVYAPQHVGGGPAEWSRFHGGRLGTKEPTGPGDPDAFVLDEKTGKPVRWDWAASGTVELNCLLCHLRRPDNRERIQAIRRGEFRWASTATLVSTGLVKRTEQGYTWDLKEITPKGTVSAERLGLGHAWTENCRQCHGRACRCNDPLVYESSRDNGTIELSGTIFSPARMSQSAMNLKDKARLTSPWDVHAERLLTCSQCHHAPNNPAYDLGRGGPSQPLVHLAFDARRALESEYLYRPDHNFVKGHVAQQRSGRHFAGTMRDCRDCHRPEVVHGFLPFKERHFEKLACTACHVPKVYPPTRQATDATLLRPDHEPIVVRGGVAGPADDPASLLLGQQPTLLPHAPRNAAYRLKPHLLHTSWFWVAGSPPRPVRRVDLERALFNGNSYHPAVITALDTNNDGVLQDEELRLDTQEKVRRIAERLRAVGVEEPRIYAELQPFTVSHGVGHPSHAIRDCTVCHSRKGRLCTPTRLAPYAPGGVMPLLVADSDTALPGTPELGPMGDVVLRPMRCPSGIYIMGAQKLHALDWLGMLAVCGTFVGAGVHAMLRYRAARARKRLSPSTQGGTHEQ